MHNHGWIDTVQGGHVVCPGDWIVFDVINGKWFPCKPDVFKQLYELVQGGNDMVPRSAIPEIVASALCKFNEEDGRVSEMMIYGLLDKAFIKYRGKYGNVIEFDSIKDFLAHIMKEVKDESTG